MLAAVWHVSASRVPLFWIPAFCEIMSSVWELHAKGFCSCPPAVSSGDSSDTNQPQPLQLAAPVSHAADPCHRVGIMPRDPDRFIFPVSESESLIYIVVLLNLRQSQPITVSAECGRLVSGNPHKPSRIICCLGVGVVLLLHTSGVGASNVCGICMFSPCSPNPPVYSYAVKKIGVCKLLIVCVCVCVD